MSTVITDVQGNRIRTTETRADITFEFQKADGRVHKVRDSAVFGDVTQPLFAVGKLWKNRMGNRTPRCIVGIPEKRTCDDTDSVWEKLDGYRYKGLQS